MEELKEKRRLNTKVFDNKDGSFTMNAHAGHIHYKDLNTQKLRGIDNNLVKKGNHYLMDKASYHLRAPIFSDEFIKFDNRFEGAQHSIEFRPVGEKKEYIKTDKCHLLAKNVFGQGIDLELAAGWNSFRKEVIINEKPADLTKDLEFKFEIKADGLKLKYAPYQLDQATLDKIIPLEERCYKTLKDRLTQLAEKNRDGFNETDQQEWKDIKNEREFLVGKIDRLRRKVWDKTNQRETILDIWFDDDFGKRSWFRRFIVWDSEGNAQKIKIRLTRENGKLFLIKIIPKKFLEKAIYPIRTDTTTSYYTGAGDGVIFSGYSSTAWDTIHDATTTNQASDVHDTDTSVEIAGVSRYDNASPPDINIRRGFLPVDTSGLPDNAIISAATMNLYVISEDHGDDDAQAYLVIVGETSQAVTNALTREDYDQCGAIDNPTEGSDQLSLNGMATGQYVAWTLDATGRGWISKTGFTMLGMREGHDVEDITIAVIGHNRATIRFSEYADTGSDPYLSVTYTEPAGVASGSKMMLGIGT